MWPTADQGCCTKSTTSTTATGAWQVCELECCIVNRSIRTYQHKPLVCRAAEPLQRHVCPPPMQRTAANKHAWLEALYMYVHPCCSATTNPVSSLKTTSHNASNGVGQRAPHAQRFAAGSTQKCQQHNGGHYVGRAWRRLARKQQLSTVQATATQRLPARGHTLAAQPGTAAPTHPLPPPPNPRLSVHLCSSWPQSFAMRLFPVYLPHPNRCVPAPSTRSCHGLPVRSSALSGPTRARSCAHLRAAAPAA